MERRDLLKYMAASSAFGMMPGVRAMPQRAPSVDPLSGERLFDHVVQYTQIGEHRTGTTGDQLTAEWIGGEFQRYGLETKFHPITMNLFEVTSGFLEFDNRRVRADPEWYPSPTPEGGITANLRVLEPGEDLSVLRGKIWVAEVQMRRPIVEREFKERALAAARAGALGVVMLLTFRSTELTGRGAHGEWGQETWCPVPLVGVAAKHGSVLEAAKQGKRARLVVEGREERNARAYNVTGAIGGGKKQIVITTPQSGMFRCGGERGGGLAVLLGLAAWAGKRRPDVRYLFSTNTGHEQDASGAEYLLHELAPPPPRRRYFRALCSRERRSQFRFC